MKGDLIIMYPNYNYYPAAAPLMQPQSGLKGRPVSSLDEARAANIDFDGSLFIFPDVGNKKIYTKQINLDGTAAMRIYAQVEETSPAPAYVTREEFESFVNSLRKENTNESKSSKSSSTTNFSF